MKAPHYVWLMIVLLALFALVRSELPKRREDIRRDGAQRVAAEQKRQAEEIEALKLHQRSELEAAWGGGMDVFLKDPDASVTQMLQRAAARLVPDWTSSLEVEDFTDFELALHLPGQLHVEQLRLFLETYLPVFESYLTSIRLMTPNGMMGIIDHSEIQAFVRWLYDDAALNQVVSGEWRGDDLPEVEEERNQRDRETSDYDIHWEVGEGGQIVLSMTPLRVESSDEQKPLGNP